MAKEYKFAFSEGSTIEVVTGDKRDGSRITEYFSPEFELFSTPSIRKLIMEMHAVFTSSCIASKTAKLSSTQAVSFSRQYRSVLQRVCENGEETSAWSLFETLFFCPAQTPLVCDITLWAQQSFSDSQRSMSTLIEERSGHPSAIDLCPSYWNTVVLHILSCQWGVASSLLEEGTPDDARKALAHALSTFNFHWLTKDETLPQVDKWQKKLKDEQSSGIFSKNGSIDQLVNILLGKENAISTVSSHLSRWWQLVPILLLTKYRVINPKQLQSVAQKARNLWLIADPVVDVFDSMLSLNVHDSLSHLSSSIWISVHLTDLLYHTEQDRRHSESTLELRRSLLREYGTALFAHSGLWQLGVDYLYNAGREGQNDVMNLLCSLPLDSERTARRALREAEMAQMGDGIEGEDGESNRATRCIVKTMSMRHLKGRRWAPALSWAHRDYSGECMDDVVTRILHSATGEEIGQLEIIEQFGDRVLASSSLTLLFNLYRFHRADREEDKENALKILVDTVTSPDLPVVFSDKLLNELLRFLDTQNVGLDANSIYSLLELIKTPSMEKVDQSIIATIRMRLIDALSITIAPLPNRRPHHSFLVR
ncbi:npp-2 [Pristionchus pacificus]|nr:npp-2 [Pristionchus pacificus]